MSDIYTTSGRLLLKTVWTSTPSKPARRRKPNLTSVAKQAAKAGLAVARYEVDPESGKIAVVTGQPEIIPAVDNAIDASEWN